MPGCLGRSWPHSLKTEYMEERQRPALSELHACDLQPAALGHCDPGLTCRHRAADAPALHFHNRK